MHDDEPHPKEQIRLSTRAMAEVTIDTEETLDAFVQYTPEPVSGDTAELPEELSRPMLRINYHDDIPEVYNRIIAAVERYEPSPHLFLYPKRVREDAIEVDEEMREQLRGQGLLGCLAQVESEDSATYKTTSRLLQSTDPAAEIEAIYDEYSQEEIE
jgi:hypothetical protein